MANLVRKSGVGDTSCDINRSLGEEYDSEDEINRSLGEEYDSKEVFDLASDSLILTSSDRSYM